MAAKKPTSKKKPDFNVPDDRPVSWQDLGSQGRAAAAEGQRQMGMLRTKSTGAIEKLKEAEARSIAKGTNPERTKVMRSKVKTAEMVQSDFQDKPITMEGATRRRVGLTQEAFHEAKQRGTNVEGAGWYFDHSKEIMDHAQQYGFSRDRAMVTTSLSAQSDPTSELRAGKAVMDAVGAGDKHTVHITPELRAVVNRGNTKRGHQLIPSHMEGQHIKVSELHADHIAGIGTHAASLRNHGHAVDSTIDFEGIGGVRANEEVKKTVHVLRGEMEPHEAINPYSAPKLHSYWQSNLRSVHGSDEHEEYMTRTWHAAHHPVGAGGESQGAFDLRGLRHQGGATNLGSKAQTVEDSWQQAISTGQKWQGEALDDRGRKKSPAKFAASTEGFAEPNKDMKKAPLGPGGPAAPRDARITPAGMTHAFNVHATQGAAKRLAVSMGDTTAEMPANVPQEVGWTKARQHADADKVHRAKLRGEAETQRNLSGSQFKGQGSLF